MPPIFVIIKPLPGDLCNILLTNGASPMAEELPGNLEGSFHVRIIRPALFDAHKWLPFTKDRAELRRHALKLRYWPEKHPTDGSGKVLDLNWEWIKALSGKRVGELRIQDRLGGHDNLRVIFFDPKIRDPIPTLWILAVLQKKRDDFTREQIKFFAVRRALVVTRFYDQV